MIKDTLVVIPARGGSKGVLKKNIKPLAGKPLILYTTDLAREIFSDEDICVSTDDEEIRGVVEASGLKVPFLRPPYLATDTAGTREVIIHALNYYGKRKQYTKVLLLQPTSPFRKVRHIKEAIHLFRSNIDMVVSAKIAKANPYYTLFEKNDAGYLQKSKIGNFNRRQDCPKVYELNGSIYIINVKSLQRLNFSQFSKTIPYAMGERYSIDIDTPFDWKIAEFLTELPDE